MVHEFQSSLKGETGGVWPPAPYSPTVEAACLTVTGGGT